MAISLILACVLAFAAAVTPCVALPHWTLFGPLGAHATPRAAIPDAAAQKESLQQIKDLFKTEYARARKPAEQKLLLGKLQEQIDRVTPGSVDRYVLLTEVESTAVALGEAQAAIAAIDQLATEFEVAPRTRKLDALQKLTRSTKAADPSRAIVELAVPLLDEAMAEEDVDLLDDLGRLALSAAKKAKDNDLAAQINGRMNEIEDLKKSLKPLRTALETLSTSPDDPEANLTVGRFRCLRQGNWKAGLPMLARCSDPGLQQFAARELLNPTDGAEQAKLGNDWWSYAEGEKGETQARLQFHALDWYERSLLRLTGLEKSRVEKLVTGYEKIVSQHVLRKFPAGATVIVTFEEATADTVNGVQYFKDLASQRYRVVMKGTATLEPGKAGQALGLSPASGRIEGASISGASPRTFCLWAKHLTLEGDNFLWDSGDLETLGQFGIYKDATWEARADVASGRVISEVKPDLDWHHHALTYDGTQIGYYIDGKPAASKRLALKTAPGAIFLGSRTDGGYVRPVVLDEFAAFSRALSPREIQSLYAAGVARRPLVK